MIVILNGPLGIGKTETAWKLLEYFERAAILDCDYIGGNVSTFDYRNPSSFRTTIECVAVLAKHQKNAIGINDFVVSGVFESKEQLTIARSLLSEVSVPVVAYLLYANPIVLENRVRNRGNVDVEREIARALELLNILDPSNNDLGKPFDTSNLMLEEATEKLWKDIQLTA
jgi:hypothetical protein